MVALQKDLVYLKVNGGAVAPVITEQFLNTTNSSRKGTSKRSPRPKSSSRRRNLTKTQRLESSEREAFDVLLTVKKPTGKR